MLLASLECLHSNVRRGKWFEDGIVNQKGSRTWVWIILSLSILKGMKKLVWETAERMWPYWIRLLYRLVISTEAGRCSSGDVNQPSKQEPRPALKTMEKWPQGNSGIMGLPPPSQVWSARSVGEAISKEKLPVQGTPSHCRLHSLNSDAITTAALSVAPMGPWCCTPWSQQAQGKDGTGWSHKGFPQLAEGWGALQCPHDGNAQQTLETGPALTPSSRACETSLGGIMRAWALLCGPHAAMFCPSESKGRALNQGLSSALAFMPAPLGFGLTLDLLLIFLFYLFPLE